MLEFNNIDVMNLKAISRRRAKLTSVLGYWDAINRSYPTYFEFKTSISKLHSIGIVRIHTDGRFMTLSNLLHKKMNVFERIIYFFKSPETLILNVLKRQSVINTYYNIEITEDDYNLALKDYYFNAIS